MKHLNNLWQNMYLNKPSTGGTSKQWFKEILTSFEAFAPLPAMAIPFKENIDMNQVAIITRYHLRHNSIESDNT